MAVLGAVTAAALAAWLYQVRAGMGVAGIGHPVGWGVYISNYIFWVGIAMSGTLVSAMLHLVRAPWRKAVSRSAEAMTLFAISVAGIFPLIHLGRLWVFYFIMPYPSQRQIWPDFTSPLVWDMAAILCYLIVSTIFFFVGLMPDVAAARDHSLETLGPDHPRTRFYRALALGWCGAGSQWRHHSRGYLFFAALATPLAVSVHSVVAWDFAMGILAGWHSTIFAPYFVAGAILSGQAMAITLMIPVRRFFRLERYITPDHFEAMAKIILVTALIVGYSYGMEMFTGWYSGSVFERQFASWRATGWVAPFYLSLFVLNVLVPMAFLSRRARRTPALLLPVALLINVGMWLERYVIVAASTAHGYLPHTWGSYWPNWVEWTITAGSFAFFLFGFLAFSRLFPPVALSEVKSDLAPEEAEGVQAAERPIGARAPAGAKRLMAVFAEPGAMLAAAQRVRELPVQAMETFSPVNVPGAEVLLGRGRSPVRFWTLAGVLLGAFGGFYLSAASADLNGLIVGGKPPVAVLPFLVMALEGGIFTGAVLNLIGLLVHARLGRTRLPEGYDRRFSLDRFGLLVACEDAEAARRALEDAGAEEVHALE